MALANYTDLQASIANWLSRSDLGTVIPDFVALAESSISTDVRLRPTVATLSTVANQDWVALPADWLEFVYVKVAGEPLAYIPPDVLREQHLRTGDLCEYSVEGQRLLLNPTPGTVQTIDISYHARLPALSVTPTNWLLTAYPDIYLFKCLALAWAYLQDENKAGQWNAQYLAEVERIRMADRKSRSSGGPLRIRPR